jgi:molecular chaperone DnaK
VHEKARAEQLIADARQAIADEAGLDRVRGLAADLQQVIHGLQTTTAASGNGADGGNGRAADQDLDETANEDVVDAEFTRD